MVNADHLRDAQPWQPMKSKKGLKVLGKLAEEAGELIAAVSRCVIQGPLGTEPVSKKMNKHWLEDEIADVLAGVELTINHFKLNREYIEGRKQKKIQHLRVWHRMK